MFLLLLNCVEGIVKSINSSFRLQEKECAFHVFIVTTIHKSIILFQKSDKLHIDYGRPDASTIGTR